MDCWKVDKWGQLYDKTYGDTQQSTDWMTNGIRDGVTYPSTIHIPRACTPQSIIDCRQNTHFHIASFRKLESLPEEGKTGAAENIRF